jgi:hypothetical protein
MGREKVRRVSAAARQWGVWGRRRWLWLVLPSNERNERKATCAVKLTPSTSDSFSGGAGIQIEGDLFFFLLPLSFLFLLPPHFFFLFFTHA